MSLLNYRNRATEAHKIQESRHYILFVCNFKGIDEVEEEKNKQDKKGKKRDRSKIKDTYVSFDSFLCECVFFLLFDFCSLQFYPTL